MSKRGRKLILLLFASVLCLAISACGRKANSAQQVTKVIETPYQQTKFLMGTVVQLRIYNDGKKPVLKKAFDRIEVLANKITVNQKGSEIDQVNHDAGVRPVKVSADIYRLVKRAVYYSQHSDGAFDLAIGPITSLWHIGFSDARKPAQSEIDQRLPLVDYRRVKLNDAKKTVYLTKKGMALDLGGIAKGFITDEVVKVLKANGVSSAIIDLGGNIFVLGKSPGHTHKAWTVGIQDPKAPRGSSIGSLPASNKTIVTSGIYERNLEVDGHIYMHLMNPKTGYPFENNLMGVSIVTDRSIDGDALSTATFDKGLQAGLKFIEQQPHTEAIFVTKDMKVYITSGLKNKFKLFSDSGYQLANT